MKITRNYDGQTLTIELTDAEIQQAYEERQLEYDMSDVRESLLYTEECGEFHEGVAQGLMEDEAFVRHAAIAFRDLYDYGSPGYDLMDEAVRGCIYEYLKQKGVSE